MIESAIHRMKLEGEDPHLFGPSNRRHEARMPLTFPIEVSGFDRRDRFFTEQSSCFDVGEASCAFRLRTEVEEGAVVAIRSFHWQNSTALDSKPVLFQVARVESEKGRENANDKGTENDKGPESEAWIVAAVRLQPAQPQNVHGIGHLERAVS